MTKNNNTIPAWSTIATIYMDLEINFPGMYIFDDENHGEAPELNSKKNNTCNVCENVGYT